MSIPAGNPYREISSGEMLKHFLEDMEITPYRLAKETEISHATISRILSGDARITPAIALRFSAFFENSAQFWLNCQNTWDLANARKALKKSIKKIRPYSSLTLHEV